MSNELVLSGSHDGRSPLKGYRRFFGAVPNYVVRAGSDVLFVAWSSVEASCLKWDLGGFHCETVPLLVEYDGETIRPPLEYASIDQIAKIATMDPKAIEYVDWTTRVDLEIPRRAQAHSFDIENDKDVMMVKALDVLVRRNAMIEHLAKETARRQTLVELQQKTDAAKLAALTEQSADTKRVAAYAADMARETEYYFAIPWLKGRGITVPDEFWGTVGNEIRMIANQDEFYPKQENKRAHKGYDTHRYPPIQMDKYGGIWIERNRQKPKRATWFLGYRPR